MAKPYLQLQGINLSLVKLDAGCYGSLNGPCVGVPVGAFRLRNGSYPATEVARRARRNSPLISVCVYALNPNPEMIRNGCG